MNLKEKEKLLYFFPELELSYEKNLHNKVQNIDYYLTIPHGMKYFAWFYNFKNKNTLFILKINRKNNRISDIQRKVCSFDSKLCIGHGTVFYGTIFHHENIQFFNIEDIFYHKGIQLKNKNNLEKLLIEKNILTHEINRIIYQKNDIIFGLPIISFNYNQLKMNINKIPYRLFSIQHRFLKKQIRNVYNERVFQNIEKIATFSIQATIQPDIYDLYCYKNNNLIKHGTSHISSFKNSVVLNSIFRNIKENINLDFLEESDDEEEFENISPDKYLKNNTITMECRFIQKFKSWEPISRSKNKISNYSFILSQEK